MKDCKTCIWYGKEKPGQCGNYLCRNQSEYDPRRAWEEKAERKHEAKGILCCCPLLEISYLDEAEIKYIRRTYRDGLCFTSEVDIPPHGRLIDADELIERAYRLRLDSRELIVEMINDAPTIIPPGRK